MSEDLVNSQKAFPCPWLFLWPQPKTSKSPNQPYEAMSAVPLLGLLCRRCLVRRGLASGLPVNQSNSTANHAPRISVRVVPAVLYICLRLSGPSGRSLCILQTCLWCFPRPLPLVVVRRPRPRLGLDRLLGGTKPKPQEGTSTQLHQSSSVHSSPLALPICRHLPHLLATRLLPYI